MSNSKKKFKVTIIEPYPHFHAAGGVEAYSRAIIEGLKDKFEFYDFSIGATSKKFKVYPSSLNRVTQQLRISKNLEKKSLFKNFFINNLILIFAKKVQNFEPNNFDVIIYNNLQWLKFFDNIDLSKTIFVQHNSPEFYNGELKHSNIKFLFQIGYKIIYRFPFLQNAPNVVLYDKYGTEAIKPKGKNVNEINIPYWGKILDFNEINLEKKKDIVFYSRIDNNQKNIKFLINVAKNLHQKIEVYGHASKKWQRVLNKSLNINYHGSYDKKNLKEFLSKSRVYLMTSNIEGFPFTYTEALANGVPVIARNTFPSAQILNDEGKTGILVDAKSTPKEFAQIVENFLNLPESEYQQYVKNCLDFAQRELKIEKFVEKWGNLISQVAQNNNK